MTRIDSVLIKPVETEKSLSDAGKYTFLVDAGTDKAQIKLAIKEFYGVDVVKVNIVTYKAKTRTAGKKKITRRTPGKKAIITLKEGQKLNFNDFK